MLNAAPGAPGAGVIEVSLGIVPLLCYGVGMRSSRAGVVLATLFAGTFVMGSAELVVVGILELVARDLGVSVRAAGLLVTAYALGIAVGGRVLTALTVRRPRRAVLLVSLGLYVAVTAASLVTSSFGLLLALRAAAGGLQGLFLGVAFAVAGGLVAPERAGRAISAVFGGIAVSTALGVPLGTLLAQAAGWRATFAVIAVLGAGALAAAERPAVHLEGTRI
jgi:DHA1 family inner membrane transport protein